MNDEPLKIRIEIEIPTDHAAEIERSVSVDNVGIPEGIELKVYRGDRVLYIVAECTCVEPRKILTLRNTVDDLLVNVNAVLRVLETVK
ncbi:MAG: KEOPS complex subunit Pcc1 [Thermoprotei archaeon]